MEKTFNLEIITLQNSVYSGKVVSLVVPAELGYLGVLALHAPLVANLTAGKITLRRESGEKLFFISQKKGFLQVLKNNVTVLLEAVV